jgi:hypothetical protein
LARQERLIGHISDAMFATWPAQLAQVIGLASAVVSEVCAMPPAAKTIFESAVVLQSFRKLRVGYVIRAMVDLTEQGAPMALHKTIAERVAQAMMLPDAWTADLQFHNKTMWKNGWTAFIASWTSGKDMAREVKGVKGAGRGQEEGIEGVTE